MLQAYEATPVPSVLLACGDSEPVRLLAIVLEGFGYRLLECREVEEADAHLQTNVPCAALVFVGLASAEAICARVTEQGTTPLVLLVEPDEADPEARSQALQADGWERADAPAERILRRLRDMLERPAEQDQSTR